MVTPREAISAAKAATSNHDPDGSKKERSFSAGAASAPPHRRSTSGASFALMHSNNSFDGSSRSDTPSPIIEEPPSPRTAAGTFMAPAIQQQQRKTRTRKGSLRKSALLGTSKLRMEGRGESQRSVSSDGPSIPIRSVSAMSASTDLGERIAPLTPLTPIARPNPVPPPVPMVTHPVHGDPSKILEVTDAKEPFPDLKRPFKVQSSTASTTTTEEDESITSNSDLIPPSLQKLARPTDSYFPSQSHGGVLIDTVSPKPRSPLAAVAPSLPVSPTLAEWDYSETRWWGWIILCVTWIVFVVGMGSCFGVWSWAWDVGETPYAPPELEDDPTLPIVGYYPALMVLTSVMAWVWVTVAWVGMKYFRHANMSTDDE